MVPALIAFFFPFAVVAYFYLCAVDVSAAHAATHDSETNGAYHERRNGRFFSLLDDSIECLSEMSLALCNAEVEFNRAPVIPPAVYL